MMALLLAAWLATAATVPQVVDDALAFAETDRQRAARLLEDALAHGLDPRDADIVTLHAGEQRRLLGDATTARRWFKEIPSGSAWSAAARLGLLLLDSGARLGEPARAALEGFQPAAILPTQDADRHLALAIDAARRGATQDAGAHARKALAVASGDAAHRAHIEAALADLTGRATAPTGADTLARAEAALARGDAAEVRRLAAEIEAAPASPADAAAAKMLLRRITAASVDANRLAVLLPLSGRFEGAGRQVLDALQGGFADAGGDRRMVVIDSGGTAEAALAGLERAALQDGAIAVVGPLLSDETPGIAAAADALRIPLFSLSQSLEDASAHPWVVQAMPTRGGQAEALAAHVVGTKGWRRFATFAPDNAYGRSAAEAFAVAVTAAGGSIAATQWFQPDANDLIPDATKLRKVVDEHDFDALFVPQNARDLPFATAALAVVEFPMGEYLPEKGKSPYRALLGLATWNNPSLLTNGGPYVRTGLFVDVFSASAPGDQAAFVERYRTAYARTPSSLEASAWDAGRLLGTAARSDAATRDAFLAALRDARVEGSVTGADHVDAETHEVGAAMRVYTITRNGFEIVE